MSNPRKMPLTGLGPLEYKRLRERLYYRRKYKAKKIAQVKAWQALHPEKAAEYMKRYKDKQNEAA